MKPRLAAIRFPSDEAMELRPILEGSFELLLDPPGPAPHGGAPVAAALIRLPESVDDARAALAAFRAVFPDTPALLVQSEGVELPLEIPFAAGIYNILIAERVLAEQGRQLRRTINCLLNPRLALRLRDLMGVRHPTTSWRIASIADRNTASEEVEEMLFAAGYDLAAVNHVQVCLQETLNNSLFHAFKDDMGNEKYRPGTDPFVLEEDERITLEFALEDARFLFCVSDNAGTLGLDVLLRRLRVDELTGAMFEERGRGLFLLRALSSEVIFNLWPGRMTQQIVAVESPPRLSRTRPLFINLIQNARPAETPMPR